jgi:TonB family protein
MRIISIIVMALLLLSCNANQRKKSTATQPVKQIIVETENVIEQDSPKVETEIKTEEVKPDQKQIVEKEQLDTAQNSLNIKDLYKQFEKAPQSFVLDNAIDTILVCNEGTVLTIRADMFVKENGEPVNGNVILKVKEYYKLSDILLADLSTTSDGDMLETGGMLHLEAKADGVKCKLKKGKAMKIEFPYEVEKDNMQLFGGNRTEELMNWQPFADVNEQEDIENIFMVVENMAEYKGGQSELFSFISKNIKYPEIAKERGIQGIVYVQIVIDENGEVADLQVMRGVHPLLDNEALRVLRKMPKWIPGSQRGENVPVRIMIPINFNLGVGKVTTEKDYNLSELEDYTLAPENMGTLFRYSFMANNLGWINCDRFIYAKERINQYIVNSKNHSNTSFKVIFTKYNSILPGFKRGTRYLFGKVPKNEDIIIVGFEYLDKHTVGLAIKHTKTKDEGVSNLEYKPVAITELQKELENLNAISWN